MNDGSNESLITGLSKNIQVAYKFGPKLRKHLHCKKKTNLQQKNKLKKAISIKRFLIQLLMDTCFQFFHKMSQFVKMNNDFMNFQYFPPVFSTLSAKNGRFRANFQLIFTMQMYSEHRQPIYFWKALLSSFHLSHHSLRYLKI